MSLLKSLISARSCRCLSSIFSRATYTSNASPPPSHPSAVLDVDRRKRRNRPGHPYTRRRVDAEQRFQNLCAPPWLTHPPDHPKLVIARLEKEFLEELLRLSASKETMTDAALSQLYTDAIRDYQSDELSPQFIVNLLTNFLTVYDLDWLRSDVIPLVPDVTTQLGLCSYLVLACCIAAYGNEGILSGKYDTFVCNNYRRLVNDEKFGSATPSLSSEVWRTVINSSR